MISLNFTTFMGLETDAEQLLFGKMRVEYSSWDCSLLLLVIALYADSFDAIA